MDKKNLTNIDGDDTQSALADYFRMMYDGSLSELQRNHAAAQYHRLLGLSRMSSDFTGGTPSNS